MVVLHPNGPNPLCDSKVHIPRRNHKLTWPAQLQSRVGLQRWNILALREKIFNGVGVGRIGGRHSHGSALSVENPNSPIDDLHVWMQKEIALLGSHHAMEAQLMGRGIVTQT